ncbi:uncharacterized protein LOC135397249 isoform X2 [Ornithodoros turicata]|uniref:uncharacterized protein LOC135397249 isoform X2 n=1 Tax=Ornithodoros turicata TaxID=34597 RepID=UPI0031398136
MRHPLSRQPRRRTFQSRKGNVKTVPAMSQKAPRPGTKTTMTPKIPKDDFEDLPEILEPNVEKDFYRYSPPRKRPPSLVPGSKPPYGAATPGLYPRPLFHRPPFPPGWRSPSRKELMDYRGIEDDEPPGLGRPGPARTLAPKASDEDGGEAKPFEEPINEPIKELAEDEGDPNALPLENEEEETEPSPNYDSTTESRTYPQFTYDSSPLPAPPLFPFDRNNTLYSLKNHTVMCVFQSRSEDLHVYGSDYKSVTFPYPYCHLAVYCCLKMSEEYGLVPRQGEQSAFYPFPIITGWNPYIESVGVIVGGTPEEDQRFRTLFTDSTAEAERARMNFTENARRWCETNTYHRVYLFWSSPLGNITAQMTDKVTRMWTELSQYNISLGLVSEQRDNHLAAYDAGRLSQFLDPFSFLLLPPSFTDQDFRPTILTYYDGSTINHIAAFLNNATSSRVDSACVLLPACALESQLTKTPGIRIQQSQPSLGPGRGGTLTRKAGHFSFSETCDVVTGCQTADFTYFRWSLCGDTWISYPTPDLLHNFICEVQRRTGISCFGVWDTDWDDFANHCGRGRYPIMTAVFHWPLQSCDECHSNDFAC